MDTKPGEISESAIRLVRSLATIIGALEAILVGYIKDQVSPPGACRGESSDPRGRAAVECLHEHPSELDDSPRVLFGYPSENHYKSATKENQG